MTQTARTQLLAALAALALISMLVVRASEAAFTATTTDSDDSWTAGTVAISHVESGTVTFDAVDWYPTFSDSECIDVTYTGSVPVAVDFGITNVTSTPNGAEGNGLADDLTATVQLADGDCANPGTWSTITTVTGLAPTSVTTAWAPSGAASETRGFLITLTMNDAGNEAQEDSASADFSWTAKTN